MLWLKWKGERRLILALVIAFGFLSYFFIETIQLTESSPLPSTFSITWSSEYKINGQKLRGFVKTETGEKLYVVYTFSSEEEKSLFEITSLTGRTYLVQGELVAPLPPAHAYAFSMENYLISKGAKGIFEVSRWAFIEEKKSIRSFLAKQRHAMKKHIETTFPDSLVAEGQALLIGLQSSGS